MAPSQTDNVIAYGTSGVAPVLLSVLAEGAAGGVGRPGAPALRFARDLERPIRLHSLAHPFVTPPQASDLRHGSAQVAFLQDHLSKLCGTWWRPGQAFVAAYFDAVRAAVASSERELASRTGDMAGLSEPEHWMFSALMPFPRAHVRLLSGESGPGEFVPVDFAFWIGGKFTAVWIDTGNFVMPAARRAQARLAASGAEIRQVRLTSRSGPKGMNILEQLGSEFVSFLEGQRLPQTPFRPAPIGAP